MKSKTYSIFGAGAAGLYTAWRLLDGKSKSKKDEAKQLSKGDTLELYDWGQYNFSEQNRGTRAAGARVCTWHYRDDKSKSYLELGGMRYSEWDGTPQGGGHRVVTTVIQQLGLDKYSVPFNESTNPLFYLRTKNMFLNDITSTNPAPYNVDHYGADTSPDTGFNIIESLAVTATAGPQTRREWCSFYQNGRINVDLPDSSVYKKGDLLKDIGYWNLMFDQLGSEGFNYTADGNGYTSNIINWNTADAMEANNEFTPGTEYRTLTTGYSSMFNALFDAIVKLAKQKGVNFKYHPDTRLHSILQIDGVIHYSIATRKDPTKKSASGTTDAAWLAMPRYAIDLVAQATRYETPTGLDVLNHQKVQLYLESAIMQPSYKVGMFFDQPWWSDKAANPPNYPPQLTSYEVTENVLKALAKLGFPEKYLKAIKSDKNILETPFASASSFIKAVEQRIQERLTVKQEEELLATAERNTIGPSVTDMPIRQVVYFGNNALDQSGQKVYGILASYDDEMYTSFWQELELGPNAVRKIPISENVQPLIGPREAPPVMVKMLRQQLAALHFGPQSDYSAVPEPLETRYMDWSLPPFNAGYHAYAAHYDICDVQQKIRKPSQLIEGADANIFIVGETYSNDQAWVEGAYCTAESVLNDFFGITPIIDDKDYPFICPGC
ncbi:MAG TPA: hypothetical protein VNV88_02400 [Candidatus Solibacter sp.]|jgi:hypothetical protein|nr:hypothetical protein [Candidatus Solibacter sp.]